MTALARELAAALAAELGADPTLAEALAQSIAPYLPENGHGGWLGAAEAAAYLGLGSLDALDRAVTAGLPYAQPHGPGGRRYFQRHRLDAWMQAGR